MKTQIIDTHIHLDVKAYHKTLEDVLARAAEANIDKMIIPAIYTPDIENIVMLCEKYDQLYFATGHHPDYRHQNDFNIDTIESFVNHEKCIAIGECGLDYYRMPDKGRDSVIKKQKEMFQLQIELAVKYNKPIIIHSRDAANDVVEMLKPYLPGLKGVIHCWVGEEKLLELSETFYYGIGGVLTYKSAVDLRNNIKKVPISKMVLETDGPFLTPRKFGKTTNESSFIPEIINEISILTGMYKSKITENCYLNSKDLFFKDL